MNKADAALALIREARADRTTNAAAQRTVKALRALGIKDDELTGILSYLDICKPDGTPYSDKIKRTW